mmetsp:Transcript_85667/g.165994  ORF Transcript_85667/g.165994 Transcript_85667/m.165994 type:complete len:415 (+) Transcript_85667:33-1277(+)
MFKKWSILMLVCLGINAFVPVANRVFMRYHSIKVDGSDLPPVERSGVDLQIDRRVVLFTLLTGAKGCDASTKQPSALEGKEGGFQLTVPLKMSPSGTAYLVYYRIDGSLFRAILDTGSPFLMIPGSCGEKIRAQYGCYIQSKGLGEPSGLEETVEIYDGREGPVEWRRAGFTFENATGDPELLESVKSVVFGVVSDRLIASPGGVFFGLVRDADSRIRPSFLGQTNVAAFGINLASTPRTLTLSTAPLVVDDFVPLTTVLRRRFGDPSGHYTAQAKGVTVNGVPLGARDKKPIYVIVDTGVTGMVVDQALFDERFATARRRREGNLWGHVVVSFKTSLGHTLEVTARKPICTPVSALPWKGFEKSCHLVVIGLSFLEGTRLSVDIDRNRLWIEDGDGGGGQSNEYLIPKTRLFS